SRSGGGPRAGARDRASGGRRRGGAARPRRRAGRGGRRCLGGKRAAGRGHRAAGPGHRAAGQRGDRAGAGRRDRAGGAAAEAPGGIVEQAGVGGEVGYGRAGVLELGGSAGFTAAADFTSANLTPSLGWFLLDNLQISGLLGVAYIEADDQDATMFSLLVEPS